MSKGSVRVVLPVNTYAFLALVQRILKKHNEEGQDSPLAMLMKASVEEKRARCLEVQQRAEALRREVEQLMGEKNRLQKELLGTVRSARDILLGIYAQSPKDLGEWGFEVNDTPQKSAKKASAAAGEAP